MKISKETEQIHETFKNELEAIRKIIKSQNRKADYRIKKEAK